MSLGNLTVLMKINILKEFLNFRHLVADYRTIIQYNKGIYVKTNKKNAFQNAAFHVELTSSSPWSVAQGFSGCFYLQHVSYLLRFLYQNIIYMASLCYTG